MWKTAEGSTGRLVQLCLAYYFFYVIFEAKFPGPADWASLALILVAVGFLSLAEKKRVRELSQTREFTAARPPLEVSS